jgi:predicted acylesterase/phospholipase RssA
MSFRILSIDGGGIRGIIPAMVLAALEERTGRPASDLFDLVAGTSTGGILALALVRPGPDGTPAHPASELVDLYLDDGPAIFRKPVGGLLGTIRNLFSERYGSKGIDEALERRFGDTMLGQAVKPVMVTSYDIERREPYFFKSHRVEAASRAGRGPKGDIAMRHAARATSAAPTYFEPARFDVHGRSRALVDGGVFANNPAACALVEAFCEFDADPDETLVLSLGTGEFTEPLPYREVKGWGLAKWARPLLGVVFDGVSDTVNYQIQSILPPRQDDQRYLRIQTELPKGHDEMDDASQANMAALREIGERLAAEHAADLDAMAARLLPSTPTRTAEAADTSAPGTYRPHGAPRGDTKAPRTGETPGPSPDPGPGGPVPRA